MTVCPTCAYMISSAPGGVRMGGLRVIEMKTKLSFNLVKINDEKKKIESKVN